MKTWFAFLDEYDQITIVKYKNQQQIDVCERMPFIKGIFEPFTADNYFEAKKKIEHHIRQQIEDSKKRLN